MSDKSHAASSLPIDVVILWVDGDDPVLAKKRNEHLASENIDTGHSGVIPTRFASINEIKYCVLSIFTLAPFVRNVFIVTDDQDPELCDDIEEYFPERKGALKIVDHKEIFRGYEEYLPCFNSDSLHSLIWRIPDLAENFVYFNDDIFLIKEIKPEDWFIGKRPVIQGRWKIIPVKTWVKNFFKVQINRKIKGNPSYELDMSFYLRQWEAAHLAGMRSRYFFHHHTPHPLSRSKIEEYFSEHEDLLRKNISFRFRSKDQFILSSFMNHREILDGNRNLRRIKLRYLHPKYSTERLHKKLNWYQKYQNAYYMCVQSLETMDREIQDRVFVWMDELLKLKPKGKGNNGSPH